MSSEQYVYWQTSTKDNSARSCQHLNFWLELALLWANSKGKTQLVVENFFTLHRIQILHCMIQYWLGLAISEDAK